MAQQQQQQQQQQEGGDSSTLRRPHGSLAGKVALITGATSGLGLETAAALARQGATVVFGVRNVRKAERVAQELIARVPHGRFIYPPEVPPVDFSNMKSIFHFAQAINYRPDLPIHILINNAGVSPGELPEGVRHTEDGFGAIVQIDYLGPYVLTRLLERNLVTNKARVVNVSSVTHRSWELPEDDLELKFLRTWTPWWWRGGMYLESKLANVLFTYELQKRLASRGIEACAVDPGGVNTAIWSNTVFAKPPFKQVIDALYAPPADAAKVLVHAATVPWNQEARPGVPPSEDLRFYARGLFASPLMTDVDGALKSVWRPVKPMVYNTSLVVHSLLDYPFRWLSGDRLCSKVVLTKSAPQTYKRQLARKLWDLSAALCGLPTEPLADMPAEWMPEKRNKPAQNTATIVPEPASVKKEDAVLLGTGDSTGGLGHDKYMSGRQPVLHMGLANEHGRTILPPPRQAAPEPGVAPGATPDTPGADLKPPPGLSLPPGSGAEAPKDVTAGLGNIVTEKDNTYAVSKARLAESGPESEADLDASWEHVGAPKHESGFDSASTSGMAPRVQELTRDIAQEMRQGSSSPNPMAQPYGTAPVFMEEVPASLVSEPPHQRMRHKEHEMEPTHMTMASVAATAAAVPHKSNLEAHSISSLHGTMSEGATDEEDRESLTELVTAPAASSATSGTYATNGTNVARVPSPLSDGAAAAAAARGGQGLVAGRAGGTYDAGLNHGAGPSSSTTTGSALSSAAGQQGQGKQQAGHGKGKQKKGKGGKK